MSWISRPLSGAIARAFHSSPLKASSNSGNSSSSSSLWARYSSSLESHPVITKSITSGCIALCGDFASQQLLNAEGKRFDFGRLARYSLLGCFFTGPVLHFWYGLLVRKVSGALMIHNVQRLAVDQLIFSPVFSLVFISAIMTLDGQANQVSLMKYATPCLPTLCSAIA